MFRVMCRFAELCGRFHYKTFSGLFLLWHLILFVLNFCSPLSRVIKILYLFFSITTCKSEYLPNVFFPKIKNKHVT